MGDIGLTLKSHLIFVKTCDFLFTYYSSLSILLETRWPFLGDPVTYLNVATISSQIFDTRNKFSDIWRNKCTAVQRTLHLRVTSTSKTSIFKVHFFTTNISFFFKNNYLSQTSISIFLKQLFVSPENGGPASGLLRSPCFPNWNKKKLKQKLLQEESEIWYWQHVLSNSKVLLVKCRTMSYIQSIFVQVWFIKEILWQIFTICDCANMGADRHPVIST